MIESIIFLSISLTIMTVLFIVTYVKYRKVEREAYEAIIKLTMDAVEELQKHIEE